MPTGDDYLIGIVQIQPFHLHLRVEQVGPEGEREVVVDHGVQPHGLLRLVVAVHKGFGHEPVQQLLRQLPPRPEDPFLPHAALARAHSSLDHCATFVRAHTTSGSGVICTFSSYSITCSLPVSLGDDSE